MRVLPGARRAGGGLLSLLVLGASAACSDDVASTGGTPTAPGPRPTSPRTSPPGPSPQTADEAPSPAGPSGAAGGSQEPGPPIDTRSPAVAVRTLPPVDLDQPADLASGVTVTAGALKRLRVSASGPGEVAGPAIAITVRVRNTSPRALDLAGFVVTGSYGRDTPASPSDAAPADPLSGMLPSGGTSRGTYVFLVPREDVKPISVQVSSDTAADIATFRR